MINWRLHRSYALSPIGGNESGNRERKLALPIELYATPVTFADMGNCLSLGSTLFSLFSRYVHTYIG